MNGDNRPEDQSAGERAALKKVRRDLRGVGWSALAGELINSVVALLAVTLCLVVRVMPQLSALMGDASLNAGELAARVTALLAAQTWTDWYANVVVVATIAFAALSVLPYFIYGRRRGVTLRDSLGLGGLNAGEVILLSVTALGINSLAGLGVMITDAAFGAAGYTIYVDIFISDTSFSYALMTVYAVVLAPLIEECVYRGFLLGGLRRYGDRFAVTVSAVLFGLAHGNLMQFLPAVLVGLFLGYVRVKTGSWSACVLIHALNNLVSTLMDELLTRLTSDAVYALAGWGFTLGTAVAAIFLLIRLKKRYGELAENGNQVSYTALISPPSALYLYLVLRMMIVSVTKLA